MSTSLKEFITGYTQALLWSSVVIDENDEELSADSFNPSQSLLESIEKDCSKFYNDNLENVLIAAYTYGFEQAGHDFALTRNGHGVGYWDREELPKELRDSLTKASTESGECSLHLNDDCELSQ